MNILDENIAASQWQLLRASRIHVRQIGYDIARKGVTDEAIIPLFHSIGGVTFFTHDDDFYKRELCHASYCLAHLDVGQYEVARFVRAFLKHPAFNTQAKRMGKVIRVGAAGLRVWRLHTDIEQVMGWAD